MTKKSERIYPIGSYPLDKRGVSIHPFDVDERFFDPNILDLPSTEVNNHHRNYYAKNFGRFVISQTFRDLESQQVVMVRWRHKLLHDLYSGFKLPRPIVMMEDIEAEKQRGGELKIFHDEPDNKGYAIEPITDEKWRNCQREYNDLAISSLLVEIRRKK